MSTATAILTTPPDGAFSAVWKDGKIVGYKLLDIIEQPVEEPVQAPTTEQSANTAPPKRRKRSPRRRKARKPSAAQPAAQQPEPTVVDPTDLSTYYLLADLVFGEVLRHEENGGSGWIGIYLGGKLVKIEVFFDGDDGRIGFAEGSYFVFESQTTSSGLVEFPPVGTKVAVKLKDKSEQHLTAHLWCVLVV